MVINSNNITHLLSQVNKLIIFIMPKYILLGLGVPLIIFLFMYLWSKIAEKTKNRILMLIFGFFLISIFMLLYLLTN